MIKLEELTKKQWELIKDNQLKYERLSYAYDKINDTTDLLFDAEAGDIELDDEDYRVLDVLKLCAESVYREMSLTQQTMKSILKVRG